MMNNIIVAGIALSAIFSLCALAQPNPDGGPWAPVLIDMESIEVSPRTVGPRQPIRVSFRCNPGQAQKITRLQLAILPLGFETDITSALNRETGVAEYTIAKGVLSLEGAFEVRLPMDFRWDDGKTYHRSPPFGEITIRAFADWRYTPETFEEDVKSAEAEIREMENFLKSENKLPRLSPLVEEMRRKVADAREALRADDHPQAKRQIAGILAQAKRLREYLAAEEYRFDIQRYLTSHEPPKPLLTLMSGGASDFTEEDFNRIRWLGCDAVVHGADDGLKQLKAAGFQTVLARSPARYSAAWADRHPEHRQERYLLSDPVKAQSREAAIPLLAAFSKSHYEVDKDHDPKTCWRAYDATEGRTLSPDEWTFDAKEQSVRIENAQPGHDYEAAFLVYCSAVPFFGKYADPIFPACEQAILRRLTAVFAEELPGLDVYRPTSLYYPFPLIEMERQTPNGVKRHKWHNWYGYQWGACPYAQKLFEEQTGIRFDPEWMVDHRHYGGVNHPPRREYLRWMGFQQQNVNRFFKKVVELCHKNGLKVRPFWGDHWMGMEPYLDFFPQTGSDQIVKACGSAIVVRMAVDIPADCGKVIRFSPWLDWGELFGRSHPVGRMENVWADIKRGALFHVPDGLTWGGQTQTVALKDEAIARKMKEITDEFRVIYALTHGQEVFRHDLTLYVINAWGKIRSWPDWADVYPSQEALANLTDLPINVKFISLAEIADHGVPEDAGVILNCGEPESSWSGGYFWEDGRLVKAIEDFVERGGGFIGIDAPSHYPAQGKAWQLSNLLGLDYSGPTDEGAEKGIFSAYDTWRAGGKMASWEAPMKKTSAAHWITEALPDETSPLRTNVKVRATADDVKLLCSGDGATFAPPIVAVRERGAGRVVYLSGYSIAAEYYGLLRRAIFWTAHKEGLLSRLYADAQDVFTYLYPATRMLIVYNMHNEAQNPKVSLDVSLLGLPDDGGYRLFDLLQGESVAETSAKGLREGVCFPMGPHTVRFLELRQEEVQ